MNIDEAQVQKAYADFIKLTTIHVRDFLTDGFVTMRDMYLTQMNSINRVISMIPYHMLVDVKNPRDLFYMKYDDLCIDILKLYDDFVKHEVDFTKFYSQQTQPMVLGYITTGAMEHNVSDTEKLSKMIDEIIVSPFADSLAHRIIEHKLGAENFKRIKHILE